jgi:acyl-coenzyme A synthetase/AMP-(fatty) acid ligase
MSVKRKQNNYHIAFTSSSETPIAYIGDRPVSMGCFKHDVLALVEHLERHEISKTLITATERYAFAVALLASWLAKAVVILPPDRHAKSLEKIREEVRPGFECDADWAAQLITRQATNKQHHGKWALSLPAKQMGVSLYTSGSTGAPMAVRKTIANLLQEVICIQSSFTWPNSAIAGTVAAQHLYGLTFGMLLPWALGVPWVNEVPLYPQDIVTVIVQAKAGTLISVPAHYNALLQDGLGPNSLFCVSSAAPLSAQTAKSWDAQYQQAILEIYGSTETGVVAYRFQQSREHWQPFSAVQLEPVAGLLKVKSPFVSEQPATGFQTADRVVFNKHHHFQLLGRADAVVKIGGKRISLRVIEDALIACAGVKEAAVVAVSVEGIVRDKAIWAAVELDPGQSMTALALRSALRRKIDGVSIPRRFVFVDKLPCNSSGKLMRQSMQDLFDSNVADV